MREKLKDMRYSWNARVLRKLNNEIELEGKEGV